MVWKMFYVRAKVTECLYIYIYLYIRQVKCMTCNLFQTRWKFKMIIIWEPHGVFALATQIHYSIYVNCDTVNCIQSKDREFREGFWGREMLDDGRASLEISWPRRSYRFHEKLFRYTVKRGRSRKREIHIKN